MSGSMQAAHLSMSELHWKRHQSNNSAVDDVVMEAASLHLRTTFLSS